MFNSILNSAAFSSNVFLQVLICVGAAAGSGLIIALCYMFRSRYTSGFACTLILLPIVVSAVIMLVNGNIGTGIAVAGTFTLVRFRSFQGTSREIAALFTAMASGLAAGMGQLGFLIVFTLIMGAVMLLLTLVKFGETVGKSILKIDVPEDMDFENAFDDILNKYTSSFTLISSKTVSMGSIYEIKYEICLKSGAGIKKMIDEIRCRNGNLTVECAQQLVSREEL
ncbi:MAG: DUF4956 domain-containing protein [Huintestinicola sp.]